MRIARLRTWLSLTILALFLLLVTLIVSKLPRERVTQANFQRINIGMSRAEVQDLLGMPVYQTVELGLVHRPDLYSVHVGRPTYTQTELLRQGYQCYTH